VTTGYLSWGMAADGLCWCCGKGYEEPPVAYDDGVRIGVKEALARLSRVGGAGCCGYEWLGLGNCWYCWYCCNGGVPYVLDEWRWSEGGTGCLSVAEGWVSFALGALLFIKLLISISKDSAQRCSPASADSTELATQRQSSPAPGPNHHTISSASLHHPDSFVSLLLLLAKATVVQIRLRLTV